MTPRPCTWPDGGRGDHDCQHAEPTPDLVAMTDEELAHELAAEIKRDPWVLDWEYGHRGRRIREEQEHRRVDRERAAKAGRP